MDDEEEDEEEEEEEVTGTLPLSCVVAEAAGVVAAAPLVARTEAIVPEALQLSSPALLTIAESTEEGAALPCDMI